ncbi:hypothetical protein C4J86_3582 [Pseudomonas sp. R2-7-07]|nr:hypothetical protein C4J86_3582 [Pseudomonas sp. R2-7-07]
MDKRSFESKDDQGIDPLCSNGERILSFVIFIVYNFFEKCLNQLSPAFSML